MLLMMIVVMALMIGSGNDLMGMRMSHENPAHTERSSSVDMHSGAAGHEKTATKAE